jgi:hypothetical protein
MSNGELHAREREDLALHVERCAERYTAVRAEICGLRKQTRRIEGAIWGIVVGVDGPLPAFFCQTGSCQC